MNDYGDLVKRLRTRVAIRRKIPRLEPDRIANDCEAAADAIDFLVRELALEREDNASAL